MAFGYGRHFLILRRYILKHSSGMSYLQFTFKWFGRYTQMEKMKANVAK